MNLKKTKSCVDLGNERELALIREESLKMEYEDRVAKGIKEGIAQGIEEGIQQGIKQGIKQGIQEGIKQGVKQGLGQGLKKAKIDNCMKLIKNKYNKDCLKWIKELTDKQLEGIIELIFKEDEFEALKQKIDTIK